MQNGSFEGGQQAVRALRHELRGADDQKVTRITGVLDELSDPTINQSLLDPFRDRLATLKPVRPLRFSRVLFVPLDPLIVAGRAWRLGEPSIPRTVLASISSTVRAECGSEAAAFDQLIAGRRADMVQAITLAGDVIWPRAAEVLAMAPPPVDWGATGLAAAVYPPLARIIASVLRRARQLRRLARDGGDGGPEADDKAMKAILQDIAREPAESRIMITRLILLQAPHAAPALRRFLSSSQDQAEKASLQHALARGTEQVLAAMENEPEFAKEIGHASLAHAADEVRRINAVLQEIEHGSGTGKDRLRLKAIRGHLDLTCRTRFAEGLQAGLVAPLSAASGPVDGASQMRLESCTRDLRTLEMEARKVGGSASYDRLALQASDAVLSAAQAGTLSPARKIRLIEILSGPEAAEALYRQAMASA